MLIQRSKAPIGFFKILKDIKSSILNGINKHLKFQHFIYIQNMSDRTYLIHFYFLLDSILFIQFSKVP